MINAFKDMACFVIEFILLRSTYMRITFSVILSLTILHSCTKLMGVSKIKKYSIADMQAFLLENKINDSTIYFIDENYKDELLKLSSDTGLLKNHLQPLKASYYNKNGRLISSHLNCYSPGFPNLNWNFNGVMEVFPPNTQAPIDHLMTLQQELNLIKSNKQDLLKANEDFDYFVIVTWAGFLKKQSIALINAVRINLLLNSSGKRVKIIYVCSDNSFL